MYAPKTRWLQFRRVCIRWLRRYASVVAYYQKIAATKRKDDKYLAQQASEAKGRLKDLLSVKIVYAIHLIVDALEPVANFCVHNQSSHALIAELYYDWKRTIKAVANLKVSVLRCSEHMVRTPHTCDSVLVVFDA